MVGRIKAGNRVEISKKNAAKKRKSLVSVVETTFGDDEVLILMPMSSGAMVKLPLDGGFEARFYTGTSVIIFDVTVVSHPVVEGVYLTKLRMESAGEKIQLRDFHRINITIAFYFTAMEDSIEDEASLIRYRAVTRDISGGGMSFVTEHPMADGTEIYANFELETEYLVVIGKVTNVSSWPTNAPESYRRFFRCQFVAMPEVEQEKIIKFINNQQYKTVRKTRELS
jgi:c-di-GMP-binding flagellar brake protein YcgR